MANFGWFWLILGGFGWLWVILAGFGLFLLVVGGFGLFSQVACFRTNDHDSWFQKFWQIESSEKKCSKKISYYSKHVYFYCHKCDTSLLLIKHCELIPDNYVLCESRFHFLKKYLKQDSVTLHVHDSFLKKK